MGARPMTASVGGCKAVMAEAVLAAVTEKAVAALLSGVLALSNTERRTQDWYTLPPLSKQYQVAEACKQRATQLWKRASHC